MGSSSPSGKEGIVSTAYTIVTPSENIPPAVAAYMFKLPKLIHIFHHHSQGLISDVWNFKYTHFKKVKWNFPSTGEQKAIADILILIDININLLEVKAELLHQEKKALMQQLLTSQKRVYV